MNFRIEADGKTATIFKASTSARCPVREATAIALLHDPRMQAGCDKRIVVLSIKCSDKHSGTVLVCIRPTRSGRKATIGKPPWPVWTTEPTPHFVTNIPFNEWRELPDLTSDCTEVIREANLLRRQQEAKIDSEIRNRCQEIQKDAEEEDHTKTLDYYVTMRVKLAYLRMNEESIVQRLQHVRQCKEGLLSLLSRCNQPFVADWQPPPPIISTLEDREGVDPNILVTPQPEDYVLPGERHCHAESSHSST